MSGLGQDFVLVGVGGAATRFVARALSKCDGMKALAFDCDETSRELAGGAEFIPIGLARLDGRGSGGDIVKARTAAQDDVAAIRASVAGARLAVVAVSLGGGFGSGAVPEILRALRDAGTTAVCIATTPFAFEGADRAALARRALPLVEDTASAVAAISLDDLFAPAAERPLEEAWAAAAESMGSILSLFWMMAAKPGFVSLGTERIASIVSASSGRLRIATAAATGDGRATAAAETLLDSRLAGGDAGLGGVSAALLGVVAGSDLRLAELSDISAKVTSRLPAIAKLDVGVVVDETSAGSLSLVCLFIEKSCVQEETKQEEAIVAPEARSTRKGHRRDPLAEAISGAKFKGTEGTIYNGQNLDLPTYMRRNLPLEK